MKRKLQHGYFRKNGMIYRHTQYGDRFVTDDEFEYKNFMYGEFPSMSYKIKHRTNDLSVKTIKRV